MVGLLIFAVTSGLFLDVLVGIVGSRRNIGFGWAFIISLLATPIVGLIVTLISDPLPQNSEPKYGCLGYTFGFIGFVTFIIFIALILSLLFALV